MIELADIITPIAPPPAPPPYEWIALGVALLLLVLFFVLRLWLKRTRTRRLARAILKRTERDLQLGQLDARAATFQIARAVRCATPLISLPFKGRAGEGMGANAMSVKPIPHLASHPQGVRRWVPRCVAATLPQPLKGEGQKSTAALDYEWAEFKQALDPARFSPHPIDTHQAAHLLSQARRWIAHAP